MYMYMYTALVLSAARLASLDLSRASGFSCAICADRVHPNLTSDTSFAADAPGGPPAEPPAG